MTDQDIVDIASLSESFARNRRVIENALANVGLSISIFDVWQRKLDRLKQSAKRAADIECPHCGPHCDLRGKKGEQR